MNGHDIIIIIIMASPYDPARHDIHKSEDDAQSVQQLRRRTPNPTHPNFPRNILQGIDGDASRGLKVEEKEDGETVKTESSWILSRILTMCNMNDKEDGFRTIQLNSSQTHPPSYKVLTHGGILCVSVSLAQWPFV